MKKDYTKARNALEKEESENKELRQHIMEMENERKVNYSVTKYVEKKLSNEEAKYRKLKIDHERQIEEYEDLKNNFDSVSDLHDKMRHNKERSVDRYAPASGSHRTVNHCVIKLDTNHSTSEKKKLTRSETSNSIIREEQYDNERNNYSVMVTEPSRYNL